VVIETARVWMDIGVFAERYDGRFCIHGVTGPDEYTAIVNNNLYTNAMAKMHLDFAATVAERFRAAHPEAFAALSARIGLDPGEIASWRLAADRMYLPYDETLGIHAQDDSFLSKRVWDFVGTPPTHYPLLLHYHPLVIYRHQVCKQADVVLAQLLQGHLFTPEQKRRNFDYYEAVTTHDSSLSSCVHSVMAAEVGYHAKAYAYFMETARMDLDNTHGNTFHGVHTAAMAGAWMGIVQGFAGMRIRGGEAVFDPYLPEGWSRYRFRLALGGAALGVTVTAEAVEYRLLDGDRLVFRHAGERVELTGAEPVRTLVLASSFAEEPA
jgi:trehalose/maltose hydrolase-like predicted phosphorylase